MAATRMAFIAMVPAEGTCLVSRFGSQKEVVCKERKKMENPPKKKIQKKTRVQES
jgi:hypothetical protein